MSMLAEKKRKQKWSLNPQGKHWLSDSNKFGLKVLESLGWRGQGLGKLQDGIKEPIKILYKNDSKGLGLKETQTSLHQEHFNNLLQSLNESESNDSPTQISSLEKKSQKSRSRVHYKKFTRGKDLSRYSEKDLASIFEKKATTNVSTIETKEDINTEKKKDININMGSMADYFKNKIPNHKFVNKIECDNSDDERNPGFGFNNEAFVNPAFEPLGHNLTLMKRKLEPIAEIENETDVSLISCKEKKKKSKCRSDESRRCDVSEIEVDGNVKPKNDTEQKVKKRKKSKMFVDESKKDKGINNPVLQVNDLLEAEEKNVQSKSKKKKSSEPQLSGHNLKSNQFGIDNPAFQIINPTIEKVKKKKNISNDQSIVATSEPTYQIKKRKKETNKLTEITESESNISNNKGICNPAFNDIDSSSVLDIPCELMLNVVEEPVKDVKSKTSKKRRSTGCNNYGFDAKAQRIEENMTSITRTMETYQAEVENDMNEQKDVQTDIFVGEFNNCDGQNEKHEDGVLLRFKYASFKKDPYWVERNNKTVNFARKSYKHLIRGDISIGFKESNLHEIKGYGLSNKV